MNESLFLIFRILAIVTGIIILVVIHEFGHFIAAKMSKIKVTDFFVGFGPKLWSVKRGDTTYGIAAIPAGGYVKISGSDVIENEKEEGKKEASKSGERTLANVSLSTKLFVLVMGAVMNIIVAFILIAIASSFYGFTNTQVHSTVKNMPARKILKPGDLILSINGKKTNGVGWQPSFVKTSTEIRKHPNEIIKLTIKRDGQVKQVSIKTVIKSNRAMIGINQTEKKIRNLTIGESLGSSADYLYTVVSTMNKFIYKALTGRPQQLAKNSNSIVGAVVIGAQMSRTLINYLFFIGSMSLALGYLNLLPISPLDGGRALLYVIERIKGRPLSSNTVVGISAVGLAVLLLLIFYLLFKDISIIASGRGFF